MIFWKKLGILGLIIPFGVALTLQLLFGDHPNYAGIGYTLGAILVWYFGKKWNNNIDKENDFDPSIKNIPKHSLFWIQLEYWAIFFGTMGISILFTENIYDIGTDPTLLTWLISLLVMISCQVYENFNKRRKRLAVNEVVAPSKSNKPKATKVINKLPEQTLNKITPKTYKTTDHSKYMPKPKPKE